MDKFQRDVLQFHWACGLRAPDSVVPRFGDQEDLKLRTDLIDEEVQELKDALAAKDTLETIDALCDILYVTYGLAVSAGIDLEPFWDEVQKANMKKALGPKREDGKQLKPEGWRPPNHSHVFVDFYSCSTRLVVWAAG